MPTWPQPVSRPRRDASISGPELPPDHTPVTSGAALVVVLLAQPRLPARVAVNSARGPSIARLGRTAVEATHHLSSGGARGRANGDAVDASSFDLAKGEDRTIPAATTHKPWLPQSRTPAARAGAALDSAAPTTTSSSNLHITAASRWSTRRSMQSVRAQAAVGGTRLSGLEPGALIRRWRDSWAIRRGRSASPPGDGNSGAPPSASGVAV